VKEFLITSPLVIAWALLIGGILMILVDKLLLLKIKSVAGGKIEEMNYLRTAFIGLIQAIAVIPGFSRAMASILGGRLAGLKEAEAVRFSFLLATPTIAAAAFYDLYKTGFYNIEKLGWQTSLGFMLSFVFAYMAVKIFNKYYQKLSFTFFGWYRVIVGGLTLLILLYN
jgi:undecaprenyl-diphosphatase